MTSEDLRQVNLALAKAFTHARSQQGFEAGRARVPLVRTRFLQMYLRANPAGCFVAEENDSVVGFCFSRLWGKVAWLGPLSVVPAHENQGVGKSLVQAVVRQLKQDGASTIGLEMDAGSARNLAFYAKLGFEADKPSVDLLIAVKELNRLTPTRGCECVRYGAGDAGDRAAFLKQSTALAQALQQGLDYAREIELAVQSGFGDAFLVREAGDILGFFLVHTEPYSTEEPGTFLKINAVQLAPEQPIHKLERLLAFMRDYALESERTNLYLRVPLRYDSALQRLLASGFRIVHTDLRLTLRGYRQTDETHRVNLSKWQ